VDEDMLKKFRMTFLSLLQTGFIPAISVEKGQWVNLLYTGFIPALKTSYLIQGEENRGECPGSKD
jgi:hypothetical protein